MPREAGDLIAGKQLGSSCKVGQTIVKRRQTIVKRSSKAGGDRIRWGNCGVGHTAENLQRIAMLALRRIRDIRRWRIAAKGRGGSKLPSSPDAF